MYSSKTTIGFPRSEYDYKYRWNNHLALNRESISSFENLPSLTPCILRIYRDLRDEIEKNNDTTQSRWCTRRRKKSLVINIRFEKSSLWQMSRRRLGKIQKPRPEILSLLFTYINVSKKKKINRASRLDPSAFPLKHFITHSSFRPPNSRRSAFRHDRLSKARIVPGFEERKSGKGTGGIQRGLNR